jgi:AcrR family transcriptional regulator
VARPREFDAEQVVDAAMHAFWTNGYETTSAGDLCKATGLGRSSIYNAFGSKRDLFRRALRRYTDNATAHQVETLTEPGPVLDKIRTLFDQVVTAEFDTNAGNRRGCLAVNTAVELGGRDAEITADLRRGFDLLLEALRFAFQEGQRGGEIVADKDPAALAEFVHGAISGMRVSACAGAPRSALENIAAVALTAL